MDQERRTSESGLDRSGSLDYRLKVVMVGNSAVGKSSMLSSYIDNNFQFNTVPTLGIDFKFKELRVHNKTVQMQLWDTAGQDNFKAITKTYYKGADAVVMVYDITNPESFLNIKNYWLKEIIDHADAQVEIMIMGNKMDLSNERRITRQEGESFAKQNNFLFQEVTATEPQLVHQAFMNLLETVVPKRKSIHENQRKLNRRLHNKPQKSCWERMLSLLGF